MRQIHLCPQQGKRLDPECVLLVDGRQQRFALALEHMREQPALRALVRETEHVAYAFSRHLAVGIEIGMRNRLVEDRQAVAHRTFGSIRDDMQRLCLGLDAFLATDLREMRFEQFDRNASQIETLGPAEHGHRQFFDLGRGEQELHMRRGFLQRLEQGVERIAREHVNFVDDVDLVSRRDRRITHRLDNLAHVVHARMAGGVHLDHVDMTALGNCTTRFAYTAGADRRATLPVGTDAIERLGDEARGRGFADSANTGHQEGMRQAVARDRIGQRADHCFLTDELGEGLRPILAR